MSDGRSNLDDNFAYLTLECGFDLESFEYFPEGFGNFIATFRRPDLALRITCDRSQIFVDCCADGTQWLDKERLLEDLGVPRSRFETIQGLWCGYEIDNQAKDLRKHLDRVCRAALDRRPRM
jgi:hypothetical protein